jgi:hypothetical protein
MKRRSIIIAVVSLALTGTATAYAFPGGTFTLAPGENRKTYEFANLTGSLVIETDQSVNIRWIHTGEKKDIQRVTGILEVRLPKKIDGRLEAGNPNSMPATVRISERTNVSNLAQSWEWFWGTAAGGQNSGVNKAHREVKRWIKKCFGLCKG